MPEYGELKKDIMEMGKDYYGFCDRSSTDSETT